MHPFDELEAKSDRFLAKLCEVTNTDLNDGALVDEVIAAAGLDIADRDNIHQYLIGVDRIKSRGAGVAAITIQGLRRLKESKEGRSTSGTSPTMHIGGNVGAIYYGSVQGEQIQAVASASNSPVQQFVEGAQIADIRQALIQATENMLRAVQENLTPEQLMTYAQRVKEFQDEVSKENPDRGRLRQMVAILSFLSDTEGTIQLGERAFTLGSHVAPYLPLLIMLLARYFSS